MDYKEAFEKDPDGAARDYAGVSILTVRPFISRRDLITAMFADGQTMGLKHPYSDFTVTLQDARERLLPENLHWVTEMVDARPPEPFREKELIEKKVLCTGPYYAHIDLALSGDAAGMGVGHVVGSKQMVRGFGKERYTETKPIIRMDLILQIFAPPHGEIHLATLRGLLYALRELGMVFGMVSYGPT